MANTKDGRYFYVKFEGEFIETTIKQLKKGHIAMTKDYDKGKLVNQSRHFRVLKEWFNGINNIETIEITFI